MAKTTPMKLVELMVLKRDINSVIEFLGLHANFQFQSSMQDAMQGQGQENFDGDAKNILDKLHNFRAYLGIEDVADFVSPITLPNGEDKQQLEKFFDMAESLHSRELQATQVLQQTANTYKEACAFSNLKVPFANIDHVSFLSLKVGKVPEDKYDDLISMVQDRAIIVRLGEDKSHILAATSKKGRFALDTVLKQCDFHEMQIPEDFKGVPEDILQGLKEKYEQANSSMQGILQEKSNFAQVHSEQLLHLLQVYSVLSQVENIKNNLEATQMVYRMTGWIPAKECATVMKQLDELTQGRIAMREYLPEEVPSVIAGTEKVPVKLHHGTLVASFERMIFSYGSPLYGTIDPTPFVAMFFTLLFGIMFGDAGQGLVFFLAGLLMHIKVVKVGDWNKFAPVFMAIGVSSMIMGLLTGEFFATESVLRPFELWITGLFGKPREQILAMMPQSDPQSIRRMFLFFGFTIAVGFVINTIGLIINIINNLSFKKWGKAIFGKTGLSGAMFFWYMVVLVIRLAFLKQSLSIVDDIVICALLFAIFFSKPLERLLDKESPVFENGFGIAIIEGLVEVLEVLSSYLSNSVSFLRVGAFALAHAVLGYIIMSMSMNAPRALSILIAILGNAIVIVLEGMIVAIQAIRLQYYEFFSKFFNETGKEFEPFKFKYK